MKPSEFWEMTPNEFIIYCENHKKSNINDMLYLAWHIVALDRQKKLPKLQELIKPQTKTQSDEEMLNVIKSLNDIYGGEVL